MRSRAKARDGAAQTTHRRVRLALVASGLRWRGRSSVAMLAVAVFASGAAAFGSIYLHSADQLVLRGTLASAPPSSTGLTFVPSSADRAPASTATLMRLARAAPEPGGGQRWWTRPISTASTGFLTAPTAQAQGGRPSTGQARIARTLPYGPTRPFAGTLVTRTGECAHVTFVAGACPRGRSVALSARSAQLLGLHVGGLLFVRFARAPDPVALRIAGIYQPVDASAAYWWGRDYFQFGTLEPKLVALVELDGVFTTPSALRSLVPPADVAPTVQLPYRQHSLTIDQLGTFEARLAAFRSAAYRTDRVRVHTGLAGLFAHAHSVEHTAATVVGIADLELVLLGIFVLYFVASRTAAEREPDVRLAELRGFRSRSAVAVALAEPLVIVAAAVPLGLLGAWLVAGATAPAIFGGGIGVSVTPLAAVAAVAAGAAGVLAAAFGARRWRGAGGDGAGDPPAGALRRSRVSVLADFAVVAVASAAFFELVVVGDSGKGAAGSDPLAALAPGLLAAALGVAAARLVPRVLCATHGRTAFSARPAATYATRIVARRREYAAQVVLAAFAVALATFAVSGWVIAGRNRDLRAELAVGAPRVLTVSVRPGTTFLRAVRAADPGGRDAMAAVVEHARDGTTLAVDARGLPDVATWPADLGLHPSAAASRIAADRVAPDVSVDGASVSAVLTDTSGPVEPPPRLRLALFDEDFQLRSTLTLGPLVPGTRRYSAPLPDRCPGGCRLDELSVTWSPTTTKAILTTRPPSLALRVDSVSERATASGPWVRVRAGLGTPHRWTTTSPGVRLSAAGSALGVGLSLNWYGVPVVFGPADVPKALPVLVTPTSASTASGDGGPLVVGLDGETLPGRSVGEVPALPGVGPDAVLTSLQTAEKYLAAPFRTARTEVWLSQGAPHSLLARLRAHGIRVTGTRTAGAAVAGLSHTGLDLAYLLYLVAAVAAALVAVATTAFALAAGARRRQGELAALRAVGVGGSALRRAVRVEQALVLGTGIVVGTVAGAVGAVVALRSVPEFVGSPSGPPLELGLPPAALAVTVGALLVALVVVVVVGSSLVVRGATVERLSGGQ
jgi:putative ABC transport system permease protein